MLQLDNRRVAPYFPPSYYLAMAGIAFRDRVLAEIGERGINKAELSRMSGVPYHALDKFLKRSNATTSAENATAIANALGIKIDGEREYEELRALFFQLDEASRKFLIKSARGLVDEDH
jgi:lambda repressor-like predicted transcriptional regulator